MGPAAIRRFNLNVGIMRRRVPAPPGLKPVRVQCYSGTKANERPVRFEHDGREYMVDEILDQWYGPDDTFFRLRADDGGVYVLRYRPADDVWSLESLRRA